MDITSRGRLLTGVPADTVYGGQQRLDIALLRLRKLIAVFRYSLARKAFLKTGVAPSIELRPVLQGLSPEFVIDIGANLGQFTLLAMIDWRPETIVAFEPLASAGAKYNKVFGNRRDVVLHQAAIGSETREQILHVSRRSDCSSLLPVGSLQAHGFPGSDEVGVESVSVAPLETYVSGADLEQRTVLVKIDVQGYELEVLAGLEPILGGLDLVLVELSFERLYEGQPLASEVIGWMMDRGWSIQRVGAASVNSEGRAVQSDFLFAPACP